MTYIIEAKDGVVNVDAGEQFLTLSSSLLPSLSAGSSYIIMMYNVNTGETTAFEEGSFTQYGRLARNTSTIDPGAWKLGIVGIAAPDGKTAQAYWDDARFPDLTPPDGITITKRLTTNDILSLGINPQDFSFSVVNTKGDYTPPTLKITSAQLSDKVLNIDTGEKVLKLDITTADDKSQLNWIEITFKNDATNTEKSLSYNPDAWNRWDRSSFSMLNDFSWAAPGVWYPNRVYVQDTSGNTLDYFKDGFDDQYETKTLQASGIDVTALTFTVINKGSDSTKPVFTLTSPQLADGIINVDQGETVLEFNGKVNDTGSGFRYLDIRWKNLESEAYYNVSADSNQLDSQGNLAAQLATTNLAPGNWAVDYINIADKAENRLQYSRANFQSNYEKQNLLSAGVDVDKLAFKVINKNGDSKPPSITLSSAEITDGILDASKGEPGLSLQGNVVDDSAGFGNFFVEFINETTNTTRDIGISSYDLDPQGRFNKHLDFSWAANGQWKVRNLLLEDKANNSLGYFSGYDLSLQQNQKTKLLSAGIDIDKLTFEVKNSSQDVTPPTLTIGSPQLSDKKIDVNNGEKLVTFAGNFQDFGSGADYFNITFQNTSDNTARNIYIPSSSLQNNGIFSATVDFTWASAGQWKVSNLWGRDKAGNNLSYYTNNDGTSWSLTAEVAAKKVLLASGFDVDSLAFTVTNNNSDTIPPVINIFSIPELADQILDFGSGEKQLTIQGSATDNKSGFSFLSLSFSNEKTPGEFRSLAISTYDLDNNGNFKKTVDFLDALEGNWSLQNAYFTDVAQNSIHYYSGSYDQADQKQRLKTVGIDIDKLGFTLKKSPAESPRYFLNTSATSINEGATLTTTATTTNVASGTTLYYALSGTGITAADFSSGALTGTGTVGADGNFVFSHTLANDLTTEGTETLGIKLYSDAARTIQVGGTASVTITDTSTTPAPTYSLNTSATSINEGATLTTTATTTYVASGTTLYYALSGTGITSSDFSSSYQLTTGNTVKRLADNAFIPPDPANTDYQAYLRWLNEGNNPLPANGAPTGQVSVGTNGSASFSYTLSNDLSTEGAETLQIKLFSDSARTIQVGSTVSVTIADTSTTPSTTDISAFSKIVDGQVWYWEKDVPSTYKIERYSSEPYQDKIWLYSKNQLPSGQISSVGIASTHSSSMIADLSDGEWSAGTKPAGMSSGILVSQATWNNFIKWLPKTNADITGNSSTITKGSAIALNGKILDSGPLGDTLFASLKDVVDSLESFLNKHINNDGIISILSNAKPSGTMPVAGTTKVGSTLTIDASTIQDADNFTGYTPTYQYNWEVSNDNGSTWSKLTSADATDNNSTYTLTSAEVGKQVRGVVNYLDGYGTNEVVNSAASTTVANNLTVRGNSVYTIVDGPSWTQAEANSMKLGGKLSIYENEDEYSFILSTHGADYLNNYLGTGFSYEGGLWAGNDQPLRSKHQIFQNGSSFTLLAGVGHFDNKDIGFALTNFTPEFGGALGLPYIIGAKGLAETSFIRRGDSAYAIVQGPTWEEAEANAVKLGGHLVTIDDAAENEWIVNTFKNTGRNSLSQIAPNPVNNLTFSMWIGATDKKSEGQWVNPEGNSLAYTNWEQSEPNNVGWYDANGEDYAVIAFSDPIYLVNGRQNGTWGDLGTNSQNADQAFTGIAEIKLAPNNNPTGTTTLSGTLKAGQTITIDRSSIQDEDNFTGYTPTFNYSFEVSSDNGTTWTKLTSADATDNNTTYTLTNAEVGKQVRGVVSYLDGYGTQESVASTASAPISSNAPPVQSLTLTPPSKTSIRSGITSTSSIAYNVSTGETSLTGIGASLYFDSTQLSVNTQGDPFQKGLLGNAITADTSNADGDPKTDKVLSLTYADFGGNFPGSGTTLPLTLANLNLVPTSAYTGTTLHLKGTNPSTGFSTTGADLTLTYNAAPVVASTPLPTRTINRGSAFSYILPTTLFSDADSTLTLSASTATGSPLPSWLSFNPSTGTFSGTPTTGGTLNLAVSAADELGSVSAPLTLKVREVQSLASSSSQLRYQRGKDVTIPIHYTTTDASSTTGLSFKVHFNSSLFSFDPTKGIANKAQADLFQVGAVEHDTANSDNDASTDKFIPIVISSFSGNFPSAALPIKLADLTFTAADKPIDPLTGLKDTSINFSETEAATGYGFLSSAASLKPLSFSLDVDGDGKVTALGDGLMVIRHLFGAAFAGSALTDKAISPDSPLLGGVAYTSMTAQQKATVASQVAANIQQGIDAGLLDIDKDGKTTALGDGLMVIRRLFGPAFAGSALTDKAISPTSPHLNNAIYNEMPAAQKSQVASLVAANIDALNPTLNTPVI